MNSSDNSLAQLRYFAANPQTLEAEKIRRSFREFIRPAWAILEPGTPLVWNWHIDLIAEHLEAVTAGEVTRLLINIPPRHMKSRLVTVMWPCWEWASKPHLSCLFSSYAESLSRDHSRERRDIIKSDWYRERFPDVQIRDDQGEIIHFKNTRGGGMFARGTGGASTGKGGNRVVVDDPHNTKQAESETQREAALIDFDRNLNTRLNNPETDAIVVIMQRLHEKDVAGHILADVGGYVHVNLPAEAPEKTTVVFPRSKRRVARKKGGLLWPDRLPRPVLRRLKKTMGSYAYSGQYQQDPTPRGENLFPRERWNIYDPLSPPMPLDTAEQWIQSWDMAFKDTKKSAYVVGQVWARWGAKRFLIDQVRDRMSFTKSIKAVLALSAKWPQAQAKLIQDKANGPAIIDALRDHVPGILAMEPMGSKEARAEAYAVFQEAGNIWIPDPQKYPWAEQFIHEHERCPNGEFWDQIDAGGQANIYMRGMPLSLDEEDNVVGSDYAGAGFDPLGLFGASGNPF